MEIEVGDIVRHKLLNYNYTIIATKDKKYFTKHGSPYGFNEEISVKDGYDYVGRHLEQGFTPLKKSDLILFKKHNEE